jgi:hypothetical protein
LESTTKTHPEQGWAIETGVGLAASSPLAGLVGGRGCDCGGVVHAGDFGLVDSFRLLRSSGGNGGGSSDAGPTCHLVQDRGTVDWEGLDVEVGGRGPSR